MTPSSTLLRELCQNRVHEGTASSCRQPQPSRNTGCLTSSCKTTLSSAALTYAQWLTLSGYLSWQVNALLSLELCFSRVLGGTKMCLCNNKSPRSGSSLPLLICLGLLTAQCGNDYWLCRLFIFVSCHVLWRPEPLCADCVRRCLRNLQPGEARQLPALHQRLLPSAHRAAARGRIGTGQNVTEPL